MSHPVIFLTLALKSFEFVILTLDFAIPPALPSLTLPEFIISCLVAELTPSSKPHHDRCRTPSLSSPDLVTLITLAKLKTDQTVFLQAYLNWDG